MTDLRAAAQAASDFYEHEFITYDNGDGRSIIDAAMYQRHEAVMDQLTAALAPTPESSAEADAALRVTSNVKYALQSQDPGVYLIDGDEYVLASRPATPPPASAEADAALRDIYAFALTYDEDDHPHASLALKDRIRAALSRPATPPPPSAEANAALRAREAIANTLMDLRMDGPKWKPPSTLGYQEAMREYADIIVALPELAALSRPATPPLYEAAVAVCQLWFTDNAPDGSQHVRKAMLDLRAALSRPATPPLDVEADAALEQDFAVLHDLVERNVGGSTQRHLLYERLQRAQAALATPEPSAEADAALRDAARRALREADRDTDAFRDLRAALANPTPETR